ncbi:MAG: mannose-1-phosphate guanyltransferase, partial [Gemmatimonadetes bacterium]|nr:mannose-1-phosphate guanyltransferase [Gemmatimonadota bacterium]
WDDVGNWEALARTHRPDWAGNHVHGSSSVVEGSGNVVWAEGGRVVLYGVDDLVVVRTGDTTLVMPRGKAAALKDLLRELGEAT